MPWSEHILVDREILAGKPVIRETRLAVEFILELLAAGESESKILANYSGLTKRRHPRVPFLRKVTSHTSTKANPIPALPVALA